MKTTRFLLVTMLLFIGLANADTITPAGNAEEEAVEWYITLLALLTPILCLYAAWKFFKFLIKLAFGTNGGTFTDPRDGKVYKTVKIGGQIWMAENLNYDAPGSKFYDNKEENGKKYGRLYDWKTAKTVAPPGWHLPSIEEFKILLNFAGDYKEKKLSAKKGWISWISILDGKKMTGNGKDKYGFAALPGGRGFAGKFSGVGDNGSWWASSEYDNASACILYIGTGGVYGGDKAFGEKTLLLSVRCIKD